MNEEERRLEARRRKRRIQEKRRKRRVLKQRLMLAMMTILFLLILGVVMSVRSCQKRADEEEAKKIAAQKAEEKKKKDNTLHMVAVGDNIYHMPIVEEGKGEEESEDWNFDFVYENVKDDIGKADLAVVNQEAPLVKDHEDVSGYPAFGTPYEAGDALAKAGFDVVTQATNHSYDKGKEGIKDSISFWKENYPKVKVLGIHDDKDDSRVQIVKKKNFKIGMMNYTFGLNENAKPPEENAYMVDVYEEEKVKEDVEKAKEKADVVVVFLHAGVEDETEVDEQTEEKITFLAEQGVDIVIGTHPHVLRPFEMKKRPDGGKMLVYYSLGNFVSVQKEVPELLEGMADITLKKNPETGKVKITDYSMTPLVMHYEEKQTEATVYKLSDYNKKLAKSHGVHEYTEDEFTMESIKDFLKPFLKAKKEK